MRCRDLEAAKRPLKAHAQGWSDEEAWDNDWEEEEHRPRR